MLLCCSTDVMLRSKAWQLDPTTDGRQTILGVPIHMLQDARRDAGVSNMCSHKFEVSCREVNDMKFSKFASNASTLHTCDSHTLVPYIFDINDNGHLSWLCRSVAAEDTGVCQI